VELRGELSMDVAKSDSGSRSPPGQFFMEGEKMITEDLVVVPTYNEATNLRTLTHQVLAHQPFSLLIVDDGSPDGTGRIADRLATENPGRVSVLHRESKDGLGAAYRAGFSRAPADGASRIYQMDAVSSGGTRKTPKPS
jgi:dolichol-phosphate mannosyltransferase